MVELLLFLVLAVGLLALLGRTATPPSERLPLRRWTPVHVADLVARAFRLFRDAGAERVRRQEVARESVEGRQPEKPRRGQLPPPPPNPEDERG
ncbi:hypothetical protein BJF86_04425 [Serinicoccus sp. CNJ-927]|uniref:hypothetical protein n=1 Tax=Serinicoccus sp. CNJ-927 TaxID=1904970 RepID=UPI00096429B8|nr:hypothetical protein [Serinicoccus sp. CNJ-927]OLT41055.1 hypothetical protein BJF86_04425 [Serinicoccus sp. CNJ-927]